MRMSDLSHDAGPQHEALLRVQQTVHGLLHVIDLVQDHHVLWYHARAVHHPLHARVNNPEARARYMVSITGTI